MRQQKILISADPGVGLPTGYARSAKQIPAGTSTATAQLVRHAQRLENSSEINQRWRVCGEVDR
jgi:hypothetical protein